MTLEVDIRHQLGALSLDVRFRAERGLVALLGRSGSGKTSIVNVIAGLIRPAEGRVVIAGEAVFDTARRSARAAASPPHRLRVPGWPAVPASHRRAEPHLRPLVCRPRARRRRGRPRRRHARHRPPARTRAGPPFGRREKPRRDRPGLAGGAAAAADGRAARQPRRRPQAGDRALPRTPARRGRRADPLRQPLGAGGGAAGDLDRAGLGWPGRRHRNAGGTAAAPRPVSDAGQVRGRCRHRGDGRGRTTSATS